MRQTKNERPRHKKEDSGTDTEKGIMRDRHRHRGRDRTVDRER